MKYIFLLTLIFVSACAHYESSNRTPSSLKQSSWKQYIEDEFFAKKNLKDFFPDPEFLVLPWRPSSDIAYAGTPPMPSQLIEVAVNCHDKKLWPTHPQESTKEYLYGIVANYDYSKLPPSSDACLRPNPTNRFCLYSTWANLIVMSDLFQDSCGVKYRAYWLVSFLKSDDNMGTLLSKGRTVYPKPNAEFPGEYITGYTYPIEIKVFLFLGTLWRGDQEKIDQAQAEAFKHGYKLDGMSFTPPK